MLYKVLKSIKRRLFKFFKRLYFKLVPGTVACNICGWVDNRFDSHVWHERTSCPNCFSQIRHRLFWTALSEIPKLHKNNILKNKSILHFAPDHQLVEKIKNETSSYTTADFFAEGYSYDKIDINLDISNMDAITDGKFDCLIAFDVLEHVKDHLKGIAETNRILVMGGYCIFTVPQKDHTDKTLEDLDLLDPKEREEKFGQFDHWRIYGSDFQHMLEAKGFEVSVIDKDSFEQGLISRYVLHPPILSTHPLATNYRKVYFGKKIAQSN